MRPLIPFLLLSGCLLLIGEGCTKVPAIVGPPANPLDTLGTPGGKLPAPRLRVQPLAQGDETPYTPVMLPPDVRRAFVRGHTNAQRDLIAGHWWYVRIQDWAWPIEMEQTPPVSDAQLFTPLAPVPPQPPVTSSSKRSSPNAQPNVGKAIRSISPQGAPGVTAGTSPPGVFPYTLPEALRRVMPNVTLQNRQIPTGSQQP